MSTGGRLSLLKNNLFTSAIIVPLFTIFLTNFDHILNASVKFDKSLDRETLLAQNQETVFDFIIVGGGSAGCILASRLSENSSIKVLLLEAGGVPSPLTSIPTLAYLLNNQKSHDWAYRTIPQTNAAKALNNNISFWSSGKGLGGSSLINGMINTRGNVQGFDLIAKRTGDSIWSLQNVLKYYKKMENYNGWFDKSYHGRGGHLNIEAPVLVPFTKTMMAAGEELGYPIRDPNLYGPYTEGFAPVEFYLKNGRRADTYNSILKPTLSSGRKNLVLRKFSIATKILFKDGSNIAYGVEYVRHGKKFTAFANKEIILSAGVLSTPKILMLSGIGPKEHLSEFNIPVRVNSPVGKRLQDKYGAFVGPFIVPPGQSFNMFRDLNISSGLKWLSTGKGLVGAGRTEATYSFISQVAKKEGDTFAPDIHTYVLSFTPNEPSALGSSFNFNNKALEYFKKGTKGGNDGFFQLVTISRPTGWGNIKLRDTDFNSPLIIDPKYLQLERDVKILIEGVKFAIKLVDETKEMGKIKAKLFGESFPGCENYIFKTDEYYECVARHATITAYKYCGTASLGKDGTDPFAVVDSRFNVIGTKGLRVIDGSLFRINEVNTNDVTIRMVAELGSDVIKQSWKIS